MADENMPGETVTGKATAGTPGPASTSPSGLLRELAEVLIIALAVALLVRTFVMETVQVEGLSMEPTLASGQRLMIGKLTYRIRQPETGDIVVFRFPSDPSRDFVKRVIAHGGQTVELRAGYVYVDGRLLDEPYLVYRSSDSYPATKVPARALFVLGDNRTNSEDSRHPDVGMVPLGNMKGVAFLRIWPMGQLSWMGG